MSVKQYYMVHKNKGQGNAPTVTHATKHDAELEAMRLAKLNPGATYVVLGAITAYRTMDNPVVEVEIKGGPDAD